MNVEVQNAENIYNIAGNMELHSSPEVAAILKKEKQDRLKELNSFAYFDILSKEFENKKLIPRNAEIEKTEELLKEKNQILLYGDPGIGKTTLIYQISRKADSPVYISVKSKSSVSIISYLVNKIRLHNNEELIELKSTEEALEWLQVCLQKSKQFFIIDDCEQDKETVSKLIMASKFNNTFLFVSRNKNLFELTGITSYQCSNFSDEEVIQFLTEYGISPSKLELNDILTASKGNPLYLFYFSQYKISPLPQSLVDYQNSIWNALTTYQQEILAFICIPYFSINISELSEILNPASIIELSNEIDGMASLINNRNGHLELFHPSFDEFVFDRLNSKGVINHYKEKLGNFYLAKKEIIQATYLLIEISPEKVENYLFDVFPSLISWGELFFALKVLETKLKFVSSDLDKGYLNYHLCHVHHLLGNRKESTICIDLSLIHLKKSEKKTFYAYALMFKAMNLIDDGKVEDAKQIADTVFGKISQNAKEIKAPLLINLSKIYVDLFEFAKGAKACKEAFEIFAGLGNKTGMLSSLVNLVTCLGQISEYRDEAEKYGLKLLGLLEESSEFSIEVIVLNALTSIYRQKGNYEKAREFGNKAIQLCQKYEMKDKVILNLINYGNIVRDEGEIDGARKIYEEALIKCKEYKLLKDEGRIYWILSAIERDTGNYQDSIEFADKSIAISQDLNFYYGVANAFREKADTFLLMDEPVKAAESLVSSASYYAKIEQFSESYQLNISKAISLYYKEGKKIEANKLINELIQNTAARINVDDTFSLILDNSSTEAVESNFELLYQRYFTAGGSDQNTIRSFLSFINYCESLENQEGKRIFKKILALIIDNAGKYKFTYSLLAIGIEQSRNLIDQDDLELIYEKLSKKLTFLSVREINDEMIFIVSIKGTINLEMHAFSDEIIPQKLAIALTLILNESPDLILDESEFIENSCKIYINLYAKEMKKALYNYIPQRADLFTEHIQSLHMAKNGYDVQEMILINTDYEQKGNLNTFPDNKVSLYFFTQTIMRLKSHFYHSKVIEDNEQRGYILNKVAMQFDYTNNAADHRSKTNEYEINVDVIRNTD